MSWWPEGNSLSLSDFMVRSLWGRYNLPILTDHLSSRWPFQPSTDVWRGSSVILLALHFLGLISTLGDTKPLLFGPPSFLFGSSSHCGPQRSDCSSPHHGPGGWRQGPPRQRSPALGRWYPSSGHLDVRHGLVMPQKISKKYKTCHFNVV